MPRWSFNTKRLDFGGLARMAGLPTDAARGDDWGRRPRDWGTAWASIVAAFIPLVIALAGYAWHVEAALSELSVRAAQASAQIQAMQHQLDDEVRREEAHNAAIDAKIDKITELASRTVVNLEDLRRELKR